MLTVTGTPGTSRYLPRSGDRDATRPDANLRAEIVQMNTRLLQIEREQRVQFERIAQIQQQLDELIRLMKPTEKPRRQRL